jgi:hypothetical protein
LNFLLILPCCKAYDGVMRENSGLRIVGDVGPELINFDRPNTAGDKKPKYVSFEGQMKMLADMAEQSNKAALLAKEIEFRLQSSLGLRRVAVDKLQKALDNYRNNPQGPVEQLTVIEQLVAMNC